jgi:hypothetical protein
VIRNPVSRCSGDACYPSFDGGSGASKLVTFQVFFLAPKNLVIVISLKQPTIGFFSRFS